MAGLQLLLAQLAGQVVIAVRLRALLCALRTCRIEGLVVAHIYPCTGIITHDLRALRKSPWSISVILVGNQIAEYALTVATSVIPGDPAQIVRLRASKIIRLGADRSPQLAVQGRQRPARLPEPTFS